MSVLDLDFYKLTMLQFIWKHYADVPVTFRLHSRKQKLSDIINPRDLQRRVDDYQFAQRLSTIEREYLADLGIFEEAFLRDLERLFAGNMSEPNVQRFDPARGEVEVNGSWFNTSLWETVILSAVSEQYSVNNVEAPDQIKRFADICAIGQSGAKWADFGTRRRHSKDDHTILMNYLAEYGEGHGFVGTSNVYLARTEELKPIGTYAHELEMVLRTLYKSEFSATRRTLHLWGEMYPRELRIALTDTYTTPKFLADHGKFLLDRDWRGVRLDSGDPFIMGTQIANFCRRHETSWDVVFSDGLIASTIVHLQRVFGNGANHISPMFGWGTGLTNPNSDLSLVMKATEANNEQTYKITDDEEKSIR